jgi:hypothetical protein
VIALVLVATGSMGVLAGIGIGWSAGYVRGVHVGHARGAKAEQDFSTRWREFCREQYQ